MVKSYLRYEHTHSFGVIASSEGNVQYDSTGRSAIAPALSDIIVWNVRQGSQERVFSSTFNSTESSTGKGQVTCLLRSPDNVFLAAGYSNGIINVFRFASGNLEMTLDGHRSQVETLAYKSDGALLVSGSRDTDIIVWDITSQTGLYRLQGHKNAVTGLHFILDEEYIVSCSKDTLLKVWDLETQHCVQTCVENSSEIWSMDVHPAGHRLVTGSSDNLLRVWSIEAQKRNGKSSSEGCIKLLGSIPRTSNDRVAHIEYTANGDLVGVQSTGRAIELYHVRSEEELKKKRHRREKRMREKVKKKKEIQNELTKDEDEPENEDNEAFKDEFELLCVLRPAHKVKSFSFSPKIASNGSISMLLKLQNNSLESYALFPDRSSIDDRTTKQHAITMSGHRLDVRCVQLSSDNQLILSLSSASVKIWNAHSLQCIRTVSDSIDLALCAIFAPGNMHVVVGTKTGALLLHDINSGECIWKAIEAHHDNAIWSMDLCPDLKEIVTGGADQHVKFWEFVMQSSGSSDEVEQASSTTSNQLRLGLSPTRLLKMTDDVLCVRYSHHKSSKDRSKLMIAVALLDSTVKIFYEDNLKFFVSLYGHKLPVMSLDISSDNTLLVTGSADKNVKLWGLDFGDCHKSIFAHDDAIMCVRFVRNTHYFFTASKDNNVSYWDADHYERILRLDSLHFGQVWSLAVSSDGQYVITASQDRSMTKLIRTEDQVFLELEKEKELDTLFESDMTSHSQKQIPQNGTETEEDEDETLQSASASKRTIESVKSGDTLLEAIDLALKEREAIAEYEALCESRRKKMEKASGSERVGMPPERTANALLLGYSPLKYVLHTMRRIPSHHLEEALLVLPIERILKLIRLLLAMISNHLDVEFCCHVLLIILTVHHTQVNQQKDLLNDLELLWLRLRKQLQAQKSRIGFNLAGLRFISRQIQDEKHAFIVEVDPVHEKPSRKKKKAKVSLKV
uniref:Uncharacterized protein AlNc14C238G9427 n=1 Tax=Albugo laibachii Nc14 TaxID=890382 RepID=F0WST1_9STRA|nr:conserved hypothetical protein [Albugo laibachii Nc14]|eukprot:CCA24409.1 conserved hypothetical protein [Albugo laibachii Nc14]